MILETTDRSDDQLSKDRQIVLAVPQVERQMARQVLRVDKKILRVDRRVLRVDRCKLTDECYEWTDE